MTITAAPVLVNGLKAAWSGVGTGTVFPDGPVAGFRDWTVVAADTRVYYVIQDLAAGQREVGVGTKLANGGIQRDVILDSTNGGALVNFGAGTKEIFSAPGASVYEEVTGGGSAGLRGALFLDERIAESVIPSGPYAGLVRLDRIGDVNVYFANLGLYPFVETAPTIVQAHLNAQIALFYGATGTGQFTGTGVPGGAGWTSLHGTAWTDQVNWPHDVVLTGATDPAVWSSGTPVPTRADSHDSYAATFVRLAVRYATVAPGGLAWWDANWNSIRNALFWNIIFRQIAIGGGAGFFSQTFQDNAVFPILFTMDNIEVAGALRMALDLMATRGGSQATDAANWESFHTNIISGIRWMWKDTPNAAGDVGWLSTSWDTQLGSAPVNELTVWFPGLTVHPMLALYQIPIAADTLLNRDRLVNGFNWLQAKAPGWWMSRPDPFPWAQNLAAAAMLGYDDLVRSGIAWIQRTHALSDPSKFRVHEVGWIRLAQQIIGSR